MAKIEKPLPVKLFVAVFTKFDILFQEVKNILVEKYGEIDAESPSFGFSTFTNYYEKQMGSPLVKKFFSFSKLIEAQEIIKIKLFTNQLEEKFACEKNFDIKRPVNIDPGYVCLGKIVLASAKDYSHRIYLGEGIYAETTLRFEGGTFCPWQWTYPDYKTQQAIEFFNLVRSIYKKQLAQIRQTLDEEC